MRSQRRARLRSWVTRTRVAPRSRFRAKSRSMIELAGGLVEVAGRLVGHQDRRVRARWRGRSPRAAARRRKAAPGSDAGARRAPPRCSSRFGARESVVARPPVRGAARRFPAPSWSGTRWKDWNTMPMRRPRKRASASSSRPARSVPSTTTLPESGRSSPAMVISSVDLPEPDGPTRPTASPRADLEGNPLEDMHPRGRRARGSNRHCGARWPCPYMPVNPILAEELRERPAGLRRARLIWEAYG